MDVADALLPLPLLPPFLKIENILNSEEGAAALLRTELVACERRLHLRRSILCYTEREHHSSVEQPSFHLGKYNQGFP